jgi:hypothetical protein
VALGSFDGRIPARQWIIRLQLAKASVEAGSAGGKEVVQYTNTGDKFTFHSGHSIMKLETLGPIESGTKPDQPLPVKRAEISVATDFLALDLARAALVVQRIKTSQAKPGLTLSTGTEPFSAEEINVQRPRAVALNLTEEERHSFAGSLPALMQFLQIVQNTPDLQPILHEVLNKPSVFDMLKHPGAGTLDFQFIGGGQSEGQEIIWPGGPHRDFALSFFALNIFGKPVLNVVLYLTTPQPPLQTSAGIVGLFAWTPGKPDKVLGMRILSASAGPTVP